MADTLPAFAEISDLETRMKRSFVGDEVDEAELKLNEASTIIRVETDSDWVDSDGHLTAPDIFRIVTLRVVDRALRNPDGFSAETAADYSYQRNGVGADGALYLTPQELKWLRRGGGSQSIWTQGLTRGECPGPEYVMDQFGAEPFVIGGDCSALVPDYPPYSGP